VCDFLKKKNRGVLNKESSKTPQHFQRRSPCQKLCTKKIEEKTFSLVISPYDFLSCFLAVSLYEYEELKNTTTKNRTNKSSNKRHLKKKKGRSRSVVFT
jgi:hypothetical protein